MSEENKYSITINTWNKIADLYNEKFMDLKIYDESYDVFCKLLPAEPRILEIGCGPGNITKYLKNKIPNSRILATDVSPNMMALAKKNVPEAEFQLLDARNIKEVNEIVDGIMCGFCIPYIGELYLTKMIGDFSSLLNKNGIIYLSCIEGKYEDSDFESGSSGDKAYVYYYEEKELLNVLLKNNFKLERTFKIDYKKGDGSQQVHLIIIASKT